MDVGREVEGLLLGRFELLKLAIHHVARSPNASTRLVAGEVINHDVSARVQEMGRRVRLHAESGDVKVRGQSEPGRQLELQVFADVRGRLQYGIPDDSNPELGQLP